MLSSCELPLMSQRLRALARDGGSVEAAQVKLLGLDEIREAAGARWPRLRERVRAGSLSILQQHCAADDVIIAAGDGFLIVLAEGKPGDAQRRCQGMREALLAFYLGEDGLAALRPEVKKHALTSDGLSELIAVTARERVAESGVDSRIALAPVVTAREHRLGAMLSGPLHCDSATRRLCYNPDFLLDGRHHERLDYLELDLAVLDAALARLSLWKDAGRAGIIGVTVHSSTMQSRRLRENYLRWLAKVDPARRRMLFACIAEVERGTPLIAIAEWCSCLRTLTSRIWLEFHFADYALGSIGATGAWAAGFSLPTFVSAQRGPRGERLRSQIRYWSKTLSGQGMRLLVHGVRDEALLGEAAALGVNLLTSDTHWPFAGGDAKAPPTDRPAAQVLDA